jgi:hypothetical protein
MAQETKKEAKKEPEQQIFFGDMPMHELFQKQVQQVMEQTELDDESRQALLVALNCPCCGAGGMNYTAKVNRKKKPGPVL